MPQRFRPQGWHERDAGLSVHELLIVGAIIATELGMYEAVAGSSPDPLSAVCTVTRRDPLGNPHKYLKIRGVDPPPGGQWRKDRVLVPINSGYDPYSMGPEGKSLPPLTARLSRDDIIRAADGAFFGPAEGY